MQLLFTLSFRALAPRPWFGFSSAAGEAIPLAIWKENSCCLDEVSAFTAVAKPLPPLPDEKLEVVGRVNFLYALHLHRTVMEVRKLNH